MFLIILSFLLFIYSPIFCNRTPRTRSAPSTNKPQRQSGGRVRGRNPNCSRLRRKRATPSPAFATKRSARKKRVDPETIESDAEFLAWREQLRNMPDDVTRSVLWKDEDERKEFEKKHRTVLGMIDMIPEIAAARYSAVRSCMVSRQAAHSDFDWVKANEWMLQKLYMLRRLGNNVLYELPDAPIKTGFGSLTLKNALERKQHFDDSYPNIILTFEALKDLSDSQWKRDFLNYRRSRQ